MSLTVYKSQRWTDEDFGAWSFPYRDEDMYEGLIRAVKAFRDIFVPDKFSYSAFGYGAYSKHPWNDITRVEDIRMHINPAKTGCYVFGKFSIIRLGRRAWIEGIGFFASKLFYNRNGYSDVGVRLYTDDWYLGDMDVKSHKTFNVHLRKMRQALSDEATDWGGPMGAIDKDGFVIEKLDEARKVYAERLKDWEK